MSACYAGSNHAKCREQSCRRLNLARAPASNGRKAQQQSNPPDTENRTATRACLTGQSIQHQRNTTMQSISERRSGAAPPEISLATRPCPGGSETICSSGGAHEPLTERPDVRVDVPTSRLELSRSTGISITHSSRLREVPAFGNIAGR